MFKFKTRQELKEEAPQRNTLNAQYVEVVTRFYSFLVQIMVEEENKLGKNNLTLSEGEFDTFKMTLLARHKIQEVREWPEIIEIIYDVIANNTDWGTLMVGETEDTGLKLHIMW